MAAYLITEIEVTDPKGYEEYRARVGKSLEQFGARFLVRGGEIDVLEGNWPVGEHPLLWDGETAGRAADCLRRRFGN